MSSHPTTDSNDLEQLIDKNVPRDALMAFEDAYRSGDQKGRLQSAAFSLGHRSSAAGHNKHFCINETFYEALQVHGANPTPLRGSWLVVGRLGVFNIARLNVPGHKWVDLKRSATRKKLAQLNESIERKYVQGDLFSQAREVSAGALFIVGVMDGVDENDISQLTQVLVALPAPNMKSWLRLWTMDEFLKLYDQPVTVGQPDSAVPKLKPQKMKKTGNDQGN